jgi:Cu(I)-responsive transcriptional regulator
MNISEAAIATGLSAKTIRYYEKEGVITAAKRGDNGYRQYDTAQIEQLLFIKRARGLGFSLADSQELLDLANNPSRTSAEVKQRAVEHLHNVEEQIKQLESIRSALNGVIEACAGDENSQCPILEKLGIG